MKCQVNGASYQKQVGPLQPLPIPPGPWHSMCMELITTLSESQGYDAIKTEKTPYFTTSMMKIHCIGKEMMKPTFAIATPFLTEILMSC